MTKKRGLLSRMFFQEPRKQAPVAPTPAPTPFEEIPLADLNRPISNQWVRLTIHLDGAQTQREMTDFPFDIGR